MTVWKEWDYWAFEYFDVNIDADKFFGGEGFVALWKKKKGDRPFPKWSDYDWDELKQWHPSLILNKISWDPFDYKYEYCGANYIEKFGMKVSEENPIEFFDSDYDRKECLKFYQFAAKAPYIVKSSGNLVGPDQTPGELAFIEVMLSDTGDKATHWLSLMIEYRQ